MAEPTSRLEHVLADQRFPAARWELIARAQHYGADVHTMCELHDLPELRYRSLGDVARSIAEGRARVEPRIEARLEQYPNVRRFDQYRRTA